MDGGLEQPPGCPELGGLTHRDSDGDPSWYRVYAHPAEPRDWWREPVPSPSLPVVVSHEGSKCNTLQPFFSLNRELETQLRPGMGGRRRLWGRTCSKGRRHS